MQKLLPVLLVAGTLSVPALRAQEPAALPLAEVTLAETKPKQPKVETSKPAPKPANSLAPSISTPMPVEAERPPVKTVKKRTAFPERTPASVEESPESAETPKKKKTFWEWLFGPRKPKATPEPDASTPAATPKATPRPKRPKGTPSPENPADPITPETTPAPKPTKPKATPTPKPEATEKPESEPEVKPSTPVPTPTPKKTTKPATPAPTNSKRPTAASTAPISEESDAQEKERYDVAKAKAGEDAEIIKLKEKADGAVTDDEARKAQRAYNKALFNKIRSLDSSVKERADRIEAGIMRRLQE